MAAVLGRRFFFRVAPAASGDSAAFNDTGRCVGNKKNRVFRPT